eukprot:scaffold584_cov121-Isochrysis_galbana.AAC.5
MCGCAATIGFCGLLCCSKCAWQRLKWQLDSWGGLWNMCGEGGWERDPSQKPTSPSPSHSTWHLAATQQPLLSLSAGDSQRLCATMGAVLRSTAEH